MVGGIFSDQKMQMHGVAMLFYQTHQKKKKKKNLYV